MKIKLNQCAVFTIPGFEKLGEMRLESTWENFIKIKGELGVLILKDERGTFQKSLATAFDSQRDVEYTIIEGSPAILATLSDNRSK